MNQIVVGWTDTYIAHCPIAEFSESRRRALVERIRKRKYNFNFTDYQFLSFCCPVYEDGKICVLSKQQFDDVMKEAWKDMPITKRFMPIDVINIPPVNGVLYEKEKFIPKDGENNG